ncbi:hypothetical protein PCK1_000363 [Pneumocystis canis]|nr:hypothetical protein PCK1_000363 [Pneumocystis canis]
MSNSIYFKFKSQKEPGRISFDGTTGLSVFDVKREIILQNKLGSGTEFDLAIYNSNNEEYDDDTTIIPRSTSITVRRLPPLKPGKGTAARYVTGNPSIESHNRSENFSRKPTELKTKPVSLSHNTGITNQKKNDPEDAAIQAMFAASNEQWQETQDKLANATPIFRPNNKKLMSVNVPDRPPPVGYVCYRCGEKGHWIQSCPTLSDPSFDGKLRVKRTTGIPKSFLKTVEKTFDGNSGSFMVNAEGEYVVAEPDNASWENYKSKTKTLTALNIYSFKPDDSTLECALCHKLMRNPSKIPCCQEEYCEECIQTSLLENDFVCPKCGAKDILLNTIQINNDKKETIREYINSKMTNEDVSVDKKNIYGLPQYNNYKHYPLDISKYGYFPNQQKVFGREEDSPYTRIPLNDRNTHRQKRMRHADFTELA